MTTRPAAVAWQPEKEGRCRKHPNRHPSPGVCPICVKDRLASLLTNSKHSSSPSAASYFSSTSSRSSQSTTAGDDHIIKEEEQADEIKRRTRLSSLMSKEKEEENLSSSLSMKTRRPTENSTSSSWPARSRSDGFSAKGLLGLGTKAKKEAKQFRIGGGLWGMIMLRKKKKDIKEEDKGKKRWGGSFRQHS